MSSGLESVRLVKCLLLAGMPTHLWLVIKQEVPPGRNPLRLSPKQGCQIDRHRWLNLSRRFRIHSYKPLNHT
jgi:hypothetical protein